MCAICDKRNLELIDAELDAIPHRIRAIEEQRDTLLARRREITGAATYRALHPHGCNRNIGLPCSCTGE